MIRQSLIPSYLCFFFFNDTATTEIYTLSLHDALPILTTIEGLSKNRAHAVQRAWIEEDVPQCGYCQSGQIMAAAALLARTPHPTDADIDTAMTNICRCGTYRRIRAAIHRAAQGA